LQEPRYVGGGGDPVGIAAADLNGDGNLDLAVTDTILLGDGTRAFEPTPAPRAVHPPTSMTVGDLNGDGLTDLILIGAGIDLGPLFDDRLELD
jgi:hypothetical protein